MVTIMADEIVAMGEQKIMEIGTLATHHIERGQISVLKRCAEEIVHPLTLTSRDTKLATRNLPLMLKNYS